MRSTTCFDWVEEPTCLIIARKSNLYDPRGLLQRPAVDNSHVSLDWLYWVLIGCFVTEKKILRTIRKGRSIRNCLELHPWGVATVFIFLPNFKPSISSATHKSFHPDAVKLFPISNVSLIDRFSPHYLALWEAIHCTAIVH